MRARSVFLSLCVVILSGCGSAVRIGPLLKEFDAYDRDARKLAPTAQASEYLSAAQAKREQAEPLLKKGKNATALPIMEKAVADARLALAAGLAEKASGEAEACREELDRTRRIYQDAILILRETEKAAKAAPHEIPGESTAAEADPSAALPPSLPAGQDPPVLDAGGLQSAWQSISGAASARGVSLASPAARFETHADLAVDPKTPDRDRAGHVYVATRALQEAEATLRARMAESTCMEAGQQIARLSDGHDLALRATLEMERDMKDALRAEARDRQTELYDALHQLEGKYAHIQKTARGTILSLADVLFDFDKATLKRDVEFNLVKVATILNQFSEMKIAVEGHTDNVGTAEYNLDLSQRRAQAVRDFLVSQEVAPERMTVAGYGLTRPVADNATDAGRQKNRRVDLVIQDGQ
jgi:outer membrane protein OmpA-like peptidoglycan-associated protein